MATRKGKAESTGEVMSTRALNRALLARQMLLAREERPVADAVEWLVGMQAQVPQNPYVALWSRLHAFDPLELSQLIESREAVRMLVMRGTLHLVTARDCLALRPVFQPTLERLLQTGSPFGREIRHIDTQELLSAGRALVTEKPRTGSEIGRLLQERWPEVDAMSLSYSIQYCVPMVQITPRGLWGRSGQATWTTVERWLGRELGEGIEAEALILRYLAAFGPARVADFQAWSGLTRQAGVLESLRPRLLSLRDEQGNELFDLPEAPRPDTETPAPTRFFPDYDNVYLAHADRSRIVPDDYRKKLIVGPRSLCTFTVDGFIAGTWKLTQTKQQATILLEPRDPLTPDQRIEAGEEAARLTAFLAPGAAIDVQFIDSSDPRAPSTHVTRRRE